MSVPGTKREYYDWLVASATGGAFPSYREVVKNHRVCAYRGGGKKKCAAGGLIPDGLYARYGGTLENMGTIACALEDGPGWFKSYPVLAECVRVPGGMEMSDVAACQSAHDNLCTKNDGFGNYAAWDARAFIDRINGLPCFAEFQP